MNQNIYVGLIVSKF